MPNYIQPGREDAKTTLLSRTPDFSNCQCLTDVFCKLAEYQTRPEVKFMYAGKPTSVEFIAASIFKAAVELWQYNLRALKRPYQEDILTNNLTFDVILNQVTSKYGLRDLMRSFAPGLNEEKNYLPLSLAQKVIGTFTVPGHDIARYYPHVESQQRLYNFDFTKCTTLSELFMIMHDTITRGEAPETFFKVARRVKEIIARRNKGEQDINYDFCFKDFTRNYGLRQKLIDLCSAESIPEFPNIIFEIFNYQRELLAAEKAEPKGRVAELPTSFIPAQRPPREKPLVRREAERVIIPPRAALPKAVVVVPAVQQAIPYYKHEDPPCQIVHRKDALAAMKKADYAAARAPYLRTLMYGLIGLGSLTVLGGGGYFGGKKIYEAQQSTAAAPLPKHTNADKYRVLTSEEQADFKAYAQAAHEHYFPYMRELMRNSKTCLQKDGTSTTDCAAAIKDLDLVEQGLTWFEQHPEQIRGYYEPIGTGVFDYGQSGMTMSNNRTLGDFSDDQLSVNLYFFSDAKGGKVEEIAHEIGHCWSVGKDHTGDVARTDWSADTFGKLIIDGKDYSYYLTALGASLDKILAIHMTDVRTNYNKGKKESNLTISEKNYQSWSKVLADTYAANYHSLDAFSITESGIEKALIVGKIPELANDLTQEYLTVKEAGDTAEVRKKRQIKLR